MERERRPPPNVCVRVEKRFFVASEELGANPGFYVKIKGLRKRANYSRGLAEVSQTFATTGRKTRRAERRRRQNDKETNSNERL